ncbi:hypothetical protein Tco_0030824 [Tanacetum coccineum]
MFIKSRIYLDDEYVVMTRNYFLQYTQLEILEFRDTLMQHMESVKKSIDKRAQHKRDETESKEQDKSSRTWNDAHADDTYIRPIYDEKPMAESERPRISKPLFASQVDVNNDLPKPVTTYYLPRERESAFEKPHHMITPSSSSTDNGSKPKPWSNTQTSRNWPASKNSLVTTKIVPIAEHSRNFRKFSESKHFVCSTCQKCVFNANHDSCVTKFLNEVNSRAKVPSNKTTKRNKLVEQISVAKKPERQILKGYRFSIKNTSVVHQKTMTPRSCLRWKPTGKNFKTASLRWVPTGKIFTSSTTKVDSEPINGSNEDITNQYECEQTLDVSAGLPRNFRFGGTSMTSDQNSSELGIHDHSNEPSSSKLVPKVVPPVDKTATSRRELELLFYHHITMLRWIPTRKTFDSCTGKVDSELTHGSNVDIPNIHVCKQTLDLSAGKRYSIKTKTKAKTAKPSTLGMI